MSYKLLGKTGNASLRLFVIAVILLFILQQASSQGIRPVYTGNNYVAVGPGETIEEVIEKAAGVTPSANQLEWQRLEFNAFIHFGINTFTGKEWGGGNEDPALFNPGQFDARQWARVIRDAGMKMVIRVLPFTMGQT